MQLTPALIQQLYLYSKHVDAKTLTPTEAANSLATEHGIHRKSAEDYLYNFRYMRAGKRISRTMSLAATEYFLSGIHRDFGSDALALALQSLRLHLEHHESTLGLSSKGKRAIYDQFMTALQSTRMDLPSFEIRKTALSDFIEGGVRHTMVNIYERDQTARAVCLNHHGFSCQVCHFNFLDFYGSLGADFIHVHHVKEIASQKSRYSLDPIHDLVPVCANCHAMLHRRTPCLSVDELKFILRSRTLGAQAMA